MPSTLILASASPYRAQQLTDVGFSFVAIPPRVDETPKRAEKPFDLALRLAYEKCRVVAQKYPSRVVVAGDQVGEVAGVQLTKPGTKTNALRQLRRCQGRTATFHSAFAIYDPCTHKIDSGSVATVLKFKQLTEEQLANYVELDQPLDCAGAFKIEAHGILLFDQVSSDDPTALIGLPMISLTSRLQAIGLPLFA